MSRIHCRIAGTAWLAFACTITTVAAAADADREAAGWHKWADFTASIVAAGKADPFDFGAIVPACDGASGVVIGQGFQFPYFAQNIIQACRVFDTFKDVGEKQRAGVDKAVSGEGIAGAMKTILKREKRILCRNASGASKELGKAEPVAAEPRAQPLALELKAQMDRILILGDC